ncbi:hypothetical protein [Paenibacillus sp. PL2-23]|uniref:hypothetical protein n=1 Tax=Paenibacillus sp. PL2-23 TaxID=2100729 RepID=UPI0030FA4537
MSRTTLNIPKTTFLNLSYIYNEILEARTAEVNNRELDHKKGREVNAKITFHYTDCYLRCKEIFEPSTYLLVEYYYDWYAGNGEILGKYHAHYHPNGTPAEITQYDPWHWHVPKDLTDKEGERQAGPIGYTIHDVLREQVLPHIMRLRRSGKN